MPLAASKGSGRTRSASASEMAEMGQVEIFIGLVLLAVLIAPTLVRQRRG